MTGIASLSGGILQAMKGEDSLAQKHAAYYFMVASRIAALPGEDGVGGGP
jgi:hypothetical protein